MKLPPSPENKNSRPKTGSSIYGTTMLPPLDDFRTNFEVFDDINLIKILLFAQFSS
jgi:hypothetical protein